MPYNFLEDIATADVAFEAWGKSVEEMFASAADAAMNVMVADLASIARREHRSIDLKADALDMLLFELLQELIFYKDAEEILLRVEDIRIDCGEGSCAVRATAFGEKIDPGKHDLIVDVKAVTLHKFKVERTGRGWETLVILDI